MFRRYIIQARNERVSSRMLVQGNGATIIFFDKAETLPNGVLLDDLLNYGNGTGDNDAQSDGLSYALGGLFEWAH